VEGDCLTYYNKNALELFTAYDRPEGYVPVWKLEIPGEGAHVMVANAPKEHVLLWHARLGHCNMNVLKSMVEHDHATSVNMSAVNVDVAKNDICYICAQAKHVREPYYPSESALMKPGEFRHLDLCGPY
jgi:GAG-pre-integrase domain